MSSSSSFDRRSEAPWVSPGAAAAPGGGTAELLNGSGGSAEVRSYERNPRTGARPNERDGRPEMRGAAKLVSRSGTMVDVTSDVDPTQLRLMAVHAHPDDESSKGAATMAR